MRSAHGGIGVGAVALAAIALAGAPGAASAAGPVQITDAGVGVSEFDTPDRIAQTLLGPDVTLHAPATINGTADAPSWTPRLPAFGRFTNGADDIGIDDGLIIGSNHRTSTLLGTSYPTSAGTSATDDDLFNVVNDAGICTFSASACVYNATSLEFSVVPTSRYIKFEYALAVTENGYFDAGSKGWYGEVNDYPDGLALFVGGRSVSDNCAVVPGTSTYLTMSTAGIVPPAADVETARAQAQANLVARIANPTAPNGFAYRSRTTWAVKFITVPLTCVVDVGAAADAEDPVDIKIVVADLNDTAMPAAVFLKGGSVRFSEDSTPAPAPDPTAPEAPDAPSATVGAPGSGEATVSWDAPAGDGGSPITTYTVTSTPDGKTCTATTPATECTITGLRPDVSHTFTVSATNAAGTSAPSASSNAITPAAAPPPPPPPPPPADDDDDAPPPPRADDDAGTPATPPATDEPTAPPAPQPPADQPHVPSAPANPAPSAEHPVPPPTPQRPIAKPIAPPTIHAPRMNAPGAPAIRMVHRVQFDEVGRYTFIYINQKTGERITQLRGSRIGKRTIGRRVSAPVLNNRKAGKRLVLNTRLAKRMMPARPNQVALRIVLRRPDGSLRAVTMGRDGKLGETAARR